MKRYKLTYPIVKIIRPFFWKECRFCGREFRRESGYRVEDYTRVNPQLYYSYCCNECAKSTEDVKRLIDKEKANIDSVIKQIPIGRKEKKKCT